MRIGRSWERGRQRSGYDKLLLLAGQRFDVYLLRFPVGSSVPRHRDPVDGARHLRLNVVLVPARRGGRVEYTGCGKSELGTITSAANGRLNIRLDGVKHTMPFHPTWKLRYLDD